MTDYSKAVMQGLSSFEETKKEDERRGSGGSFKKTDKTDYFTTNLPEGETLGTKYFRVLPPKENEPFFYEVDYHEVPVGEYGFMKLYDPAQDGQESPLNNLREAYKNSGDESMKKKAKNYYPRKFYILRGVEKDVEGNVIDGKPKFWRFRHNSNSDGVMDKVVGIVRRLYQQGKPTIFDENEGRDLILSITRQKMKSSDKTYCKVSGVEANDPSPITTDSELLKSLLSDDTTWDQVYKKYPIEYLRIVADGEIPTYSKEAGKYVAKGSEDSYSDRPKQGQSVTLDEAYKSETDDDDIDTSSNITSNTTAMPTPTQQTNPEPQPTQPQPTQPQYESTAGDDGDIELPF